MYDAVVVAAEDGLHFSVTRQGLGICVDLPVDDVGRLLHLSVGHQVLQLVPEAVHVDPVLGGELAPGERLEAAPVGPPSGQWVGGLTVTVEAAHLLSVSVKTNLSGPKG